MGVKLPIYRRGPAPAWCAPYVGLPYERGARGPERFDCWGLLMLVLGREAGLPIPPYDGVIWDRTDPVQRRACAATIAEQREAHWTPVEPGAEQAFDCVVLSIAGRPLHVGVIAGPGWMLHASEGAESAVERYDGIIWRDRVDGFWRFGGQGA
jgi:cell wall-associated NlpC family hydrolase